MKPSKKVAASSPQSQMSSHIKLSDGYTMIELITVIGIIGIVGGVSGVWLKDQLPKFYLNGATRQVRSDLLDARSLAVRQGNKFRVRFLDSYRYAVHDDDNNNGNPDPGEQLLIKDLRDDYTGVQVHSTNNPIFHPRGTASNLATVTITSSGGEKSLKVNITGRVVVQSS